MIILNHYSSKLTPVADLREAEGEVKERAVCKTYGGVKIVTSIMVHSGLNKPVLKYIMILGALYGYILMVNPIFFQNYTKTYELIIV